MRTKKWCPLTKHEHNFQTSVHLKTMYYRTKKSATLGITKTICLEAPAEVKVIQTISLNKKTIKELMKTCKCF